VKSSGTRAVRGVGGRSVLVGAVALVALAVAMTAWSRSSDTANANSFVIRLIDYGYEPSQMTWRVGQKVTVTLINASDAHPGKPHEWMVGQVPNTEESVFGPHITDGFETDFFNGVAVEVVEGSDLLMLMPGGARLSGPPPMSLMKPGVKMEMHGDMEGFMPVVSDTGRLTIAFTVPDKPGTWTYGCFQQSGQHYLNGMHGTVTVTEG
jgi:plastocyanin